MSTALSTSRTEALPAAALPPRMSGSLAYFVAGERRVGDHVSPVIGSPSAADRAEAQRLAPVFQHLCRPAEESVVGVWCARLVPAVRNPPGEHDLGLKIQAIATACHDLPALVWTAATLVEAMAEFQFWPAAADVRKLLLPHAQVLWSKRDGLARVIATGPADVSAPRAPPTEEEKAAVAAASRQFVAERSFNQEPVVERPQVKPAHLSPGALLATYERLAGEGNGAAALRAEMLRAQIAREFL